MSESSSAGSGQAATFPAPRQLAGARGRFSLLIAPLVVLAVLTLLAVAAGSAQAKPRKHPRRHAPTHPNGALRLPKAKIRRSHGVTCGEIRGQWISGTALRGHYFISDAHQAKNYASLARKAKGKHRKADLAAKKSYARRAKQHAAVCKKLAKAKTKPSGSPPPTSPPAAPTPLRFNLAGAIALAQTNSTGSAAQLRRAHVSTTAGSNLEAVDATGQLRDAVTSGTATISHFLIAPDDKLYVAFTGPVNLADTSALVPWGTGCVLAEVDPSSGVPTCVDSSLSSINWPQTNALGNSYQPIQFDNNGAVYYSGTTSSGQTVLRKADGAGIHNLITDNVWLHGFDVLPSGTVIVSGTTESTQVGWTRQISPSGSLASLENAPAAFVTTFPDGNVYLGFYADNGAITSGSGWPVVARYLSGSDQMDPKWWLADSTTPAGNNEYFDAHSLCAAPTSSQANFCSGGEVDLRWTYNSPSGKEFVVASGQGGGTLMEYYPNPGFLSSEVTDVSVAQGVGDNLVIAGTNSSGQNVLTLYNTSTNTETELLGPSNQIEIYHLNYDASGNKVLFDGLRFSDNSYVIGEIDLSTDQVSTVASSSVKWADLQTF